MTKQRPYGEVLDEMDHQAKYQSATETRPEIDAADKIVAEFEGIFGKLTATERRWLTRRIAGQEV